MLLHKIKRLRFLSRMVHPVKTRRYFKRDSLRMKCSISMVIFFLLTLLLNLSWNSMGFPISGHLVQAAQFAENVRVGIYYGSDNINTVSLRAANGFHLKALAPDGSTTLIWNQTDASVNYIRKDAWFVVGPDGKIAEYQPGLGTPAQGVLTGPHHLQLGQVQANYETALSVVNLLKQSGIQAYPAYENGWYVWAGFYTDANTANIGKKAIADATGNSDITVIPATSARYTMMDAGLNPVCVYGGVNGLLTAYVNDHNDLIVVNGKRYRGSMEFRRYADSDLTLINTLGIEPYLYGVVPSELEASAPEEALKAQAIAARTYTYKNIGRYKKWGFDLTDTISSQVYSGYEGEKVQTNLAVDATKGLKAMYNGELASLFYFSSSGGMTEDNVNVWGYSFPYLKSVPDPYEAKNSYNYYWQKVLTAGEIEKYLSAAGVDLGTVLSVAATDFSAAKRVIKLRITGTKGSMLFQRDACRTLLEFPSQMYTLGGAPSMAVLGADGTISDVLPGGLSVVSADGLTTIPSGGDVAVAIGGDGSLAYTGTASGVYVFTGTGWGHGVGMSQEGAKGFARIGYTSTQILQHYFPGIIIE